eukprot:TRINITY_DN28612_c0_g1_i2.p1 TRINITY_DN28612_c0_g1~~TRINITY_DN28612_c0_g1_i2.p1  ORF type:complete len:129 (-),score=25.78 TRINITY_DN28612_c0_g1_i2:419-805(-)
MCIRDSTQTLLILVRENDEAAVRKLFQIWWPKGRDLMLPLILTATATHLGAWIASGWDHLWLLTGFLIMSIGPYTGLILAEDIEALRRADTKGVASITRRFCRLHHPRLVPALLGVLINLVHLAQGTF